MPRFIAHPVQHHPADPEKFHRTQDPLGQLVGSLTRVVTEYPPRDTYKTHECHGLYSGPTSIAYLFLQLSRTHPSLAIAGYEPRQWIEQYLLGDSAFSAVTTTHNGVISEILAFHAVRAAAYQSDTVDVEKLVNNIRPILEAKKGRFYLDIVGLVPYATMMQGHLHL